MRFSNPLLLLGLVCILTSSCVSKKKIAELQAGYEKDLSIANKQLGDCGEQLSKTMDLLSQCRLEKESLSSSGTVRQEQLQDLKNQLADCQSHRDKQLDQVGDLTVLSQSANENIKETLSQLEKRDEYIHLLQAAKSKTDSINLALAVNLKSVLAQGIADNDVDIKVDKTVVYVNLSDKMVYFSGKSTITPRAKEVLSKIAKIIESRPDLEVMVEGYTDNVPIRNSCVEDNWDLSVKRATAVVRTLQKEYNVDPNRLIAAGRGEYNTLADNSTEEGKAINRRTRIIILPKLDQFYDLLNPANVPE